MSFGANGTRETVPVVPRLVSGGKAGSLKLYLAGSMGSWM